MQKKYAVSGNQLTVEIIAHFGERSQTRSEGAKLLSCSFKAILSWAHLIIASFVTVNVIIFWHNLNFGSKNPWSFDHAIRVTTSTYQWLPRTVLMLIRKALEFVLDKLCPLVSCGRFACLVCKHCPVFDTVAVMSIHRQGKKHLTSKFICAMIRFKGPLTMFGSLNSKLQFFHVFM